MLPLPLGHRKNIPLYYLKSEQEIKNDRYEVYNPTVLQSTRNQHSETYGPVLLKEILRFLPHKEALNILELGCGSAYLIGNIADQNPESPCYGFDYSYQMLKMADQLFCNSSPGSVTKLTSTHNGRTPVEIQNKSLSNLQFALSDACSTPFPDDSIDFCFSSFLWDRVGEPKDLLKEKLRITKPGGRIVILTPLNYLNDFHWKHWYPVESVIDAFISAGAQLQKHFSFSVEEPLDVRNNKVVWKVEGLVFDNS
jgi:ubiquinone/menaquinone biosynthesis C-methylase UbiE